MINKIDELRRKFHGMALNIRNIERLVNSDLVGNLWGESDKGTREELCKHIDDCDKSAIEQWIEDHDKLDYGEMPFKRLRKLAREKGIINWSRLCKLDIIRLLEKQND